MRNRKNEKRMLCFYLVMALVFTLLPVEGVFGILPVKAAGATSGSYGKIQWKLVANGNKDDEGNPFYSLQITGSGDMAASGYTDAKAAWSNYKNHIESITIGSGITTIGDRAFEECICLETVTMPDTVEQIGSNAFCKCYKLTKISLSKKLTTIKFDAFYYSGLTEIDLPETLTTVGYSAFSGTRLKKLTFPKNVTSIGSSVLSYNYTMESLSVEEGNTSYAVIDQVLYKLDEEGVPYELIAFAYKALDSGHVLTIPEGVQRISGSGLTSCRCYKVVLPEGLKFIDQNAFLDTGIKTLEIPDSVEYFPIHPFQGCRYLEKVRIGKGLQSLSGTFRNCVNIEEIEIDAANPYLICEDGVVYNKDKTELQFYIPKREGEVFEVPETVQHVSDCAFFGTASLERLILSENLEFTSTGYDYQGKPGTRKSSEVIAWNDNLLGVYFKGDAAASFSAGVLSRNNDKLILYYPEGASGYTGKAWSGFTLAAWHPNMSEKSEDGTVGDIHWDYEGRMGLLRIDGSGSTGDFSESNPAPWESFRDKIMEVETDGISGLGARIFAESTELLRIITDESLTSLGTSALEDCPKLLYAEVATAQTLGDSVFQGDVSLNDGIYFQRLKTAGTDVFRSCSALTTITLGNLLEEIPDGMFEDCASLVVTMIPESVTKVGRRAYRGCRSLHSINIPKAVINIGEKAFADDAKLEKVYFYGGIPNIAEDAFPDGNESLTLCYRKGQSEWESNGDTYLGLPVKALSKFYTQKRDHYSFSNTRDSFGYKKGYIIPKTRYLTLLNRTKSVYFENMNEEWGGSCLGMAGTTLEFYENSDSFKASDYDKNAEYLYDLAAPESAESSLTKLIELYQISQYVPQIAGYKGQTAHHLNDYSGLIQKIEEFERSGGLAEDSLAEPVVMEIFSPFGGHAVIPVAIDPNKDGSFDVTIYDPNYPEEFQTLIINKDLKGIRYGMYYTASYLSYELLRDVMADTEKTRTTKDESLYMSVNKSSGTVKNAEGKALSDIEGAYEQYVLAGDDSEDSQEENTAYRSYVVPEGEYVIGKKESLEDSEEADRTPSPDSGEAEGQEDDKEPVSFLVASDDMYAALEVSDPNSVLEVKDTDTDDNTVDLIINTEEEDAKVDLTLVNEEGMQKELSIEGGAARKSG